MMIKKIKHKPQQEVWAREGETSGTPRPMIHGISVTPSLTESVRILAIASIYSADY